VSYIYYQRIRKSEETIQAKDILSPFLK